MVLNARDIMRRGEILTISPQATLKDVLTILLDSDVSGLPVVTGDGELVGLVSQRDVLKRLKGAWNVEAASPEARELDTEVKRFMQTEVRTVTPGTDLSEVAATLRRERIHRVPVVENGRLVGIISTTDFLRPLESSTLMARLSDGPDARKYWSPFRSVNEELTPRL